MASGDSEPKSVSYRMRKAFCNGCKYRTQRGCALYIKPCTVKYLWHDQIDPPTICPKKEDFE